MEKKEETVNSNPQICRTPAVSAGAEYVYVFGLWKEISRKRKELSMASRTAKASVGQARSKRAAQHDWAGPPAVNGWSNQPFGQAR
jgi:hypothetical protein